MNKTAVEQFSKIEEENYSKTVFGFWLYLLTDFILFGTLFATYAVLKKSTFGGPNAATLLDPSYALIMTILITFSAYTSGIANVYAQRGEIRKTKLFFLITFALGLIFFVMQFMEFSRLIEGGNSWQKSAFLSAYFTLNGTFFLHMFFSILWTILIFISLFKEGLSAIVIRRLMCLRMFWQFLSIVWIFIFAIVYLLGEIQ